MEIQTQYSGNILDQLSKAPATAPVATPPEAPSEKLAGQPAQDVFVKEEKPAENVPESNAAVAPETVAEVPEEKTEETTTPPTETNEQTPEEPPKKKSFLDKIKDGFKKIFGVFKKKDKEPAPAQETNVTVETQKDSNPPLNVMHSSGGGTN